MLYLCATPIGNLGDVTLRALDILRSCDAVYCEDTRRTLQLLNHFDIQKPLVSCHAHNERARATEVANRLSAGENIVYVSDAGMPGISDPGAALVTACIACEQPFTVLPGASAVLTAAVLSGLPPQPFTFFGFFPRENKEQRAMLEEIASCNHLAIVYESPQRVQKTLTQLRDRLGGDCRAAVLRELTKKFEQALRGTLDELIVLCGEPLRGECVLAVYAKHAATEVAAETLDETLNRLRNEGLSVRDAAARAAAELGVPKKEAYASALRLANGSGATVDADILNTKGRG